MQILNHSHTLPFSSFPLLTHTQVKDDLCDNPCSPDKTYCFVYACCGSKDGTYFTVAFAGQLDPVLQLLRQLTYDYRTHNPMLRAHIKTLMGASAPLQVRIKSKK